MKNRRLKQIGFSLCIVLSLFVSSVSACRCSHYHEKAESETPSCYRHSQMSEAVSNETIPAFDGNDECVCVQSAPKLFSKSEKLKVEKQTAEILPFAPVKFESIEQIFIGNQTGFVKPLYLPIYPAS